ncbi:MAG: hypothetical protein KJ587_11850 [Alphaproteobacteria bacterium]|nr:hypothetical protein [Alphaproteobacteria bacterium]
MNRVGATKLEHRTGPAQWLDFLRYSLSDICARGEWDDFGLFRILNRTSFLSRRQLVFVIFHVESSISVIDREVSAFDPLFQKALFDRIVGLGFATRKAGEFGINPDAVKDYEIQLFDTSHRLLIFELDVTDRPDPTQEPLLEFVPVRVKPAKNGLSDISLGQFFAAVFAPFNGEAGRMAFPGTIGPHFEKLRAANAYQTSTWGAPQENDLSNGEVSQLSRYSRPVCALVDAEYKRLSRSPLLTSFLNERCPAGRGLGNIIVFSKMFSRTSVRYKAYHYDPVLMAGDRQIEDLLFALELVERSDLIPFRHRQQDEEFWNLKETRRGRERILNNVRGRWPAHMRLFVENALMSGSSMIKPDIFERSGIAWINRSGLSRRDEDQALLRAACLHHVLQLASPVRPVDTKNLSVVSAPYRCSGGIWLCGSFLRENSDREPDGSILLSGLVNQEQFNRTNLIYHSLLKESERRLRTKARGTYIDTLAQLVTEAASATHRRHGNLKRLCLDDRAIKAFNRDALLLSRIYPFERITLTSSKRHGVVALDELKLCVHPNPFFDRLTLHSFMREDDTVRRLCDQLILSTVLPD